MLTKGGRAYAFYIRFGSAWIVVVILLPGANEKAAWVHHTGEEEPVSGKTEAPHSMDHCREVTI